MSKGFEANGVFCSLRCAFAFALELYRQGCRVSAPTPEKDAMRRGLAPKVRP